MKGNKGRAKAAKPNNRKRAAAGGGVCFGAGSTSNANPTTQFHSIALKLSPKNQNCTVNYEAEVIGPEMNQRHYKPSTILADNQDSSAVTVGRGGTANVLPPFSVSSPLGNSSTTKPQFQGGSTPSSSQNCGVNDATNQFDNTGSVAINLEFGLSNTHKQDVKPGNNHGLTITPKQVAINQEGTVSGNSNLNPGEGFQDAYIRERRRQHYAKKFHNLITENLPYQENLPCVITEEEYEDIVNRRLPTVEEETETETETWIPQLPFDELNYLFQN